VRLNLSVFLGIAGEPLHRGALHFGTGFRLLELYQLLRYLGPKQFGASYYLRRGGPGGCLCWRLTSWRRPAALSNQVLKRHCCWRQALPFGWSRPLTFCRRLRRAQQYWRFAFDILVRCWTRYTSFSHSARKQQHVYAQLLVPAGSGWCCGLVPAIADRVSVGRRFFAAAGCCSGAACCSLSSAQLFEKKALSCSAFVWRLQVAAASNQGGRSLSASALGAVGRGGRLPLDCAAKLAAGWRGAPVAGYCVAFCICSMRVMSRSVCIQGNGGALCGRATARAQSVRLPGAGPCCLCVRFSIPL